MARLDIVLTHYRMPGERLADWFMWNRDAILEAGAGVWVVSDTDRRAPDWARVIQYPLELEIFALSRTANYGIRAAIDAGAQIVCKTDPDCILTPALLSAMASLPSGGGLCPVYRMATDASPGALAASKPWEASKGTLALSASTWEAIHGYDERQVGYGIEDGDAYARALTVLSGGGGGCVRGKDPVYHVAHSQTEQKAGNMRPDCWGRSDGFNPRNHRSNMVVRRSAWSCADWGLAVAT